MGKIAAFLCVMLAALQVSAQYYRVSVKVTGDKNLNFPNADFLVEEGKTQFKGFEARINPAGFGAEGFKPAKLVEEENKEEYEKELKEALSRKPEEKLQDALEILEARAASLAMFMDSDDDSKGKKNGAKANGAAKKTDAEVKASNNVLRKKMAAEKAMAEYDDFKKQIEKAKRNRALMKEMIDEMDKKTEARLKLKMLNASVHKSGYPFGTYYSVTLKKTAETQVLIDFETAVSFMQGWMAVEGNNNNNSINTAIKMMYVDMPKLEDIAVELGKPYCFQIAKPEEKGGSLNEALEGTTIFATNKDPNAIVPLNKVLVENFNANPLNKNGLLTAIQKDFKGKERDVIRVIVTITKQ